MTNTSPSLTAITVNLTAVPIAADDILTATEDRSTDFAAAHLLGNDGDGDGDTLVIQSVTAIGGGSVALNDDGSVTFMPDPDFYGAASFTYVVSDGHGGTDEGAVTVNVAAVYDPPLLTDFGPSLSVAENAAPALLDADVAFTDLEGDIAGGTLTVSGLLGEDRIAIRDQGTGLGEIGVSGADVTYEGKLIGTVAGGVGATLTVTFGPAATAEAVEALIENLTYANTSDTPTAARTLLLEVNDAGGAGVLPGFVELTGTDNPFAGVSLGTDPTPAFVDLDGDGDRDLVAGQTDGMLVAFRNDGGAFTELTNIANPFAGVDLGLYSAPAFADLDGDGDMDAVVGALDGNLHAFRNDGGTFTELTGGANPFDGVDVGFYATPGFLDLDNDGDMDLGVGERDGRIFAFRNDGGVFTALSGAANPFEGLNVGEFTTPAYADLDGDGDMDIVNGGVGGGLQTFRNDDGVFTELTGAANPFDGVDVGLYSAPGFVDLDGDGDLDAVVGDTGSILHAFENITPRHAIQVNVGAQNDPPTLADFASSAAFVEDDVNAAPVLLDSDVTFGDAEGNFEEGVLTVKGLIAGDRVAIRDQGDGAGEIGVSGAGISYGGIVIGSVIGGVGSTLKVTLNAAATSAAVDALIENITYANTSDTPAGLRTLELEIVDGSGASVARRIDVEVAAENDAPVLADVATNLTYKENDAPTLLSHALTLADADSGNIEGATVRIATGLGAGDLLTVGGILSGASGAVSWTYDAPNGILALTGSAAPSAYQALLRQVEFGSTSDDPGSSRSISWTVSDGAANSAAQITTIAIASVNEAPSLADFQPSTSFVEDGAPALLDADVSFTDPEGNFDGGALTVTNVLAEERVAIRNQGSGAGEIGVSGSDVLYGGNVIGSFTGGVDASLIVTFNASATSAAIEALIENLTYSNLSHTPSASSTLLLNVTDGDGADLGPAPVPATFAALAGTANPFFGLDVGSFSAPAFVDLDGDGDMDMVVGDNDTDFSSILGPRSFRNDGGAFTELTGGANPFDGLRGLYYAAPAFVDLDGDGDLDAVFGSRDGNLRVFANQGGAFGELTGAANTFLGLNIGFNAVPAFADLDGDGDLDLVLGLRQGTVRAFFSDGGKFRTDAGTFLQITGGNPILNLDVGDNSTADFVDLDGDGDLDAVIGALNGTLRTFRNDGGAFHELLGSANPFQGVDVGLGSNPGFDDLDGDGDVDVVIGAGDGALRSFVNTMPHGRIITVDVTAVNDVPLAGDDDLAAFEDRVVTLAASDLLANDRDLDGDTLIIASVTAGTGGSVTLNDDGSITFTPDPDFNGSAWFTYDISDGHAGTREGAVIVNVAAVNDAPSLAGFETSAILAENGAPALLCAEISFTDPEGNFDGGTLTVTGLLAEDRVAVRDQGSGSGEIGLSGSDVLYGGEVIGSVSGGVGTSLSVIFNASATSAAVEALIENLTYANGSNAPTAGRTLLLNVTDADGADLGTANVPATFVELAGAANPFDGVDVGDMARPAFLDIDGDGDLDVILGKGDGGFLAFRNDGGSFTPLTGAANPFGAIFAGLISAPGFGDLDGDGDLDALVGDADGGLYSYRNDGGVFTELSGAANPLNGYYIGIYPNPAFGDLDGDGDMDVLAGRFDGELRTFANDGGVFTLLGAAANPFDGVDLGFLSAPSFVDLDGDGDLDVVIGEDGGTLHAFRNDGGVFTELAGSANPFNRVPLDGAPSPAFGDLDGDGDMDAVVGTQDGTLRAFENTSSRGAAIIVNVEAVNDAPELTGLPTTVTFAENLVNAAPQLLATDVTLSDVDSYGEGGFYGGTLTVAGLLPEDKVAIRDQGTAPGQIGISGSNVTYHGYVIGTVMGGEGDSLIVTFNSDAGLVAITALIENLTYANASDTPAESRTLILEIKDGGGAAVGNAIVVEVSAQDDPPVLADVAASLDYNENDAPTAISNALTLTDSDSANLEGAAVEIRAGLTPYDLLTVNGAPSGTSGAISWAYDGPTGILILFGSAPLADYQALLRQVSFESTSDAPGTSREIVWATYSGEDGSALQTTNVTVIELNDSPFVDLDFLINPSTGTIVDYVEGDPPLQIAPRVVIFDPDQPADYAGYSVTAGFFANGTADDQLSVLGTGTGPGEIDVVGGNLYYEGVLIGSVSGGADGTALTLVFNADACACAVELATASIFYSNSSDDPSTLDRTILFSVSDDAASDSTSFAFATIHVAALDAAPELTGLAGSATFAETLVNATPQLLDADVTLSDIEGDFEGGRLTVSGLLVEDKVTIRNQGNAAGQIGLSGSDVTYGGTIIGTLSGGQGGDLVVTFNTAASVGAIEALIENLAYANASDTPTASRTLLVNLTDAGGADLGIGATSTGSGFFAALDGLGPFDGINVFGYAVPTFTDLDGDGDLDLAVGDDNGFLHAFENDGGVFTELTGSANPFDGLALEGAATPAFADIDGDGDLDLVVGGDSGALQLFGNDGGVFVARTGVANALAAIDVGYFSAPAFVDLDGDGDSDLVVGSGDGSLSVFENDGGAFTELIGPANMFAGLGLGDYAAPAFVDLDGDGDLDLVVGNEDGVLRAFENDGGTFTALTGADDPFAGVAPGSFATPSFFDFDGDGDRDAVIGQEDGTLRALENGPAHGRPIIVNVIAADDPAVAVNDPGHSTNENATVSIAVLGNDSDPDGLPSVALVDGTAIAVGAPVSLASGAIVSLNNDGTLTYDPNGRFNTLTNPSSGEIGAVNLSAPDSFTYTLGGASGGSATVNVTVNGVASIQDHLEGDSGSNTITGTPGPDYFVLSQGGDDIVSGLGGNDGFLFGAAFTAADRVDGGAGTNDQIGLQGNYAGANALVLGANTIANIEAIVVLAGFSYDITTNDGNVAAGGVLKVQATQLAAGQSLTFNGSAETNGSFIVYGGQGNDNFTGGAGNDGFYFGPGGFNGSDLVNGGAGTNDQLALDGDYTITLGGNLTGIEVVVLLHGPSGTPNHFDVTAANTLVGAGQTMTLFGLQVETGITFNGASEIDGAFKIYGGTSADTLTGGSGADWIFGGNGADALTGGAGNDIFYYDDVAQSMTAAGDILFGFASGDRIDISGIDAISGGPNDAFSFLGSGAFTNHAGELRVENQGGSTWLVQADTDGNGVADFQLTFVAADAHPITSADFVL